MKTNEYKILGIDNLANYQNIAITIDIPKITSIEDGVIQFMIGETEVSMLFSNEYGINVLRNALNSMIESIEAKQKNEQESTTKPASIKKSSSNRKQG